MERREIEIFLMLAAELHFGRTAERLHVTTARVSQTIKKLERRVGTALFDRTSRHVVLTPIGRHLRDDLRPAFDQIEAGIERAISAGRGLNGLLRVGFVGAAAGQFVLEVTDLFRSRHPDIDVQIRENQFSDGHTGLLRSDEVDVLLASLPVDEPDLSHGPVLIREDRLLAVSSRHPFARRESISFAEMARDKVLSSPGGISNAWDNSLLPELPPGARPIDRGPTFSTIGEMLSLVGAGKGTYPVPIQASRYYARPDVAYVPMHDAPPFEWGLIWRTTAETSRVRSFHQAAQELADKADRADPKLGFLEAKH